METTITENSLSPWDQLLKLIRTLGPGILTATAAIGGSHLVASTQAGAKFGWSLALLILFVNLFKYPFFRAGISYTMATGKTLQNGYAQMGKGYIGLAFFLNIFSAVVNTSALTLFSASPVGIFSARKPAAVRVESDCPGRLAVDCVGRAFCHAQSNLQIYYGGAGHFHRRCGGDCLAQRSGRAG